LIYWGLYSVSYVFSIEKIVKYRFFRFKSQNPTFQRVFGNLKWSEIEQLEDKSFAFLSFFFFKIRRQHVVHSLKNREKRLGVWVWPMGPNMSAFLLGLGARSSLFLSFSFSHLFSFFFRSKKYANMIIQLSLNFDLVLK